GLEVALMGRSNCGKSSLINRWLGRKALARTSSSPGRTRLVNFFKVVWVPGADPMTVVDLPGYGYASAPKAMVQSWEDMVGQYLEADRPNRLALLLLDIRRGPQKEEKNLTKWLTKLNFPFQVIATKADKLPAGRQKTAVQTLASSLGGIGKPLSFSALTGQGREELISIVKQRQELITKDIVDIEKVL
ncbi:MAG: ribosome biogenesis GTP-binding protein YihA/YsxC, partial [Deltaproteobacteria bacterium]|nr:ribosome biogenesis GTP-binding protein YihA/YsxC [Deltaproteobacteria bacterium]